MDQNRLVPDQMVRSGPSANSDQDQTVIKKRIANKIFGPHQDKENLEISDRTRTKKKYGPWIPSCTYKQ